jgi:catechol 2,3-dioxygenase-like lactoylglutathione lyase family enzyme
MPRGNIDLEGLGRPDVRRLRESQTPADLPFRLNKIGHVVLRVADLERSVKFYIEVLGLHVTDAYPETMVPGGMVFMRLNADHHGVALVGGAGGPAKGAELNHLAFEIGSLDELFRVREHLRRHGVAIAFEGRRRAGQQIAVEFADPDNHQLEIYWGIDQVRDGEPSRPPEQWVTASSLEEAVRNPAPGQTLDLVDKALTKG